MKPFFSALSAWSCIVISTFAIIILSIIGGGFRHKSHTLVGGAEDPELENTAAVATAIFGAVTVYAIFLVFCATQALWHWRASKRGAIALS